LEKRRIDHNTDLPQLQKHGLGSTLSMPSNRCWRFSPLTIILRPKGCIFQGSPLTVRACRFNTKGQKNRACRQHKGPKIQLFMHTPARSHGKTILRNSPIFTAPAFCPDQIETGATIPNDRSVACSAAPSTPARRGAIFPEDRTQEKIPRSMRFYGNGRM
jgi:hypothetical protein